MIEKDVKMLQNELKRILDDPDETVGAGVRRVLDTNLNHPEERARLTKLFTEREVIPNLEVLSEEEVAEAVQKAQQLRRLQEQHQINNGVLGDDAKLGAKAARARDLETRLGAPGTVLDQLAEGIEDGGNRQMIEIVHRKGTENVNPPPGRTGKSEQEALHTALNRARQPAGQTGKSMKYLHEKFIRNPVNLLDSARIEVPLLALGGAVALLGGILPEIKDHSGAGEVTRKGRRKNRQEGFIMHQSEIPGTSEEMAVWMGETEPFRLEIQFKGMVNSELEKQRITQKVYDAINRTTMVRSARFREDDRREVSQRRTARDAVNRWF
jgi:hypothetical protein